VEFEPWLQRHHENHLKMVMYAWTVQMFPSGERTVSALMEHISRLSDGIKKRTMKSAAISVVVHCLRPTAERHDSKSGEREDSLSGYGSLLTTPKRECPKRLRGDSRELAVEQMLHRVHGALKRPQGGVGKIRNASFVLPEPRCPAGARHGVPADSRLASGAQRSHPRRSSAVSTLGE
jgi:hypothetical protein